MTNIISIYFIKAPLVFSVTLAGTLLLLPKLIHIASTWIVIRDDASDNKYSLMDSPDNNRKVHSTPRPLVGGVGMLMVVSFSSLLFVPPEDFNLRGYYSAVILLGVIGFMDDFRELNYSWKFLAQLLASIIMIHYSKTVLLSLGNILPYGTADLGSFAIPVTIFCTIGVINAINMIDGLDGLAGGISLIAFISFAVISYLNRQFELMLLSLALAGAVLGFLRYNWHPAKLFMGDAGSFFLGFSLAFLSLAITQKNGSIVPPVAALLILMVPIVDTLAVIFKRIIKGKKPFSADKSHFHHVLLKAGLNKKRTVIGILFLSAVFSIIAIAGTIYRISEYYLFFIFLIYFISYLFMVINIKES